MQHWYYSGLGTTKNEAGYRTQYEQLCQCIARLHAYVTG